jgi:hypothetical protein
MKRPALTWKAIRNLELLCGFAEGEIMNYRWAGDTGNPCAAKSAEAAIEWIKRLRQWKTQQDKKKKEKN